MFKGRFYNTIYSSDHSPWSASLQATIPQQDQKSLGVSGIMHASCIDKPPGGR